MAIPRQSSVALALCCLLLQVSLAWSCTASDRAALLAFKAGTTRDNTGLLDGWVEGGDCCKFYGVTCNSQGRVIGLTLVVPPLGDDCDCPYDCCPNLQRVENHTNLVGTTLSKLTELQTIFLSNYLMQQDVTPTGLSALKNLKVLRLENTGYAGRVSADLTKITSLEYLSLTGNDLIVGPLPVGLCNLVNLQTLNLTNGFPNFFGSLNGIIPSCIGKLQKLQYFASEYGRLSGSIPASFLTLKNLKEVRLSGNGLSGQLPAITAPGLTVLNLYGNRIDGAIPTSYASLSNLVELRLGGLNLTGAVQFTNLAGTLPVGLGNLTKLQVLIIRASKITGTVPSTYHNLINLVDLELDHNQLTGPKPDFSNLPNLVTLNLEGNRFTSK
eukprot:TRINITY_DN582_c0_g1_i1.p1 TRINITY_DN582_c0_g1~~TRINITY_DN582_c0_g1_i1.p1  ORF type:complete len:400 (+),score=28.05 TRINITY_DN582_c0_g1_i1:51-1202(+)